MSKARDLIEALNEMVKVNLSGKRLRQLRGWGFEGKKISGSLSVAHNLLTF